MMIAVKAQVGAQCCRSGDVGGPVHAEVHAAGGDARGACSRLVVYHTESGTTSAGNLALLGSLAATESAGAPGGYWVRRRSTGAGG